MKKRRLVGHPFGPDTSVIFVGSFRRAATWAAREGLHLSQWTLIESRTPLVVFARRPDRTLTAGPIAPIDKDALTMKRGADDVSEEGSSTPRSTPRSTSAASSPGSSVTPVSGGGQS